MGRATRDQGTNTGSGVSDLTLGGMGRQCRAYEPILQFKDGETEAREQGRTWMEIAE